MAIRVAVRQLPPLLMGAARWTVAGLLLFAWSARRGDRRADRIGIRQWWAAVVLGAALIVCGTGGTFWGQQHVPSGVAALLIGTVPLWLTLFGWGFYRERLRSSAGLGLALGFFGLALLLGVGGRWSFHAAGTTVLLGAAVIWAAGSLHARRAALPVRPLVGTSMQMLAGGVILGIVGIAAGELGRLRVTGLALTTHLAFWYMVVVSSLIGFSAYTWLLKVAPISMVSTYGYVNPVVAVLLGWAFLDERITVRTLLGGSVIVASVALVLITHARQRARAQDGAAPLSAPPDEEPPLPSERADRDPA